MTSSLFAQWIHRGVLWHRGDLGQLNYQREYDASQYFSAEQIQSLQLLRLRRLLDHAFQHCPFYRERFLGAGFHPGDVRSLEDLRSLRPVEKSDLQQQRDRFVATNQPAGTLIPNQTGGSSGTPVSFFVTRDRLRSRTAATLRHNQWASWDAGDKVAILWGAPLDRPRPSWLSWLRARLLDRQLFLDTGLLTEAILLDYYRRFTVFRPKILFAYARAAVLFAQFLQTHRLKPVPLQSVVTSAEVLTPEERELVERVFGCPVFNRYGSREFSVIASECPAHDGMHVMAEGLYLEIVQGDRFANPGELGSILVTDLLNFGMPLIRYRIGDVGSWLAGTCACGRGLPRLGSVAGRVTDFLVGADGRVVSGAFLTIAIVAQRVSLGQVQILQTRAGAVTFRIKPGPGFSPESDTAYLVHAAKKFLGDDTRVDWEYVSEIPTLQSGKFLFSRSSVVPDFLKV